MERIRLVPDAELSWWMRFIKWIGARKLRLGEGSKSTNLLAHHKGVLFASTVYMASLSGWDRLPTRLKRLVHLRVAMRVGCPA